MTAFRPPLTLGAHGPAVEAAQRLLYRGLKAAGKQGTNKRNGQYGARSIADARTFQLVHKIQATGKIGAKSWSALEPFQDKVTIGLLTKAQQDAAQQTRAELAARRCQGAIAAAEFQIANWWRYMYDQSRPIMDYGYLPPADTSEHKFQDCSESVISQAYAVDAPDPSGQRYNGSGNTWLLRASGVVVPSLAAALPGDLLHYNGSGGSQHVTRLLNPGKGCFSFGSTPPRRRDPNYRPIVLITRHLWV